MAKFNKIAIIGVGLIGGSIGLAVKKAHLACEVTGVFRHSTKIKDAIKCGAIDKGVLDIASGVNDADLIVIATPVKSVPEVFSRVMKYAKKGAIITDVGSTKEWIVKTADKMSGSDPKVYFVGSHPMAGSEKSGVRFAKKDLFKGANCIVTKSPLTDKAAYVKVISFWRALGSVVKEMTPVQHDKVVSFISHLPHLAAFGIAGSVSDRDMKFAADGFKDTTRVAGSDPELWADIFLTNKKALLPAVGVFNNYCKNIVRAVKNDDRSSLIKLLKYAKLKREKFVL